MTDPHSPAERDGRGRFVPGCSGNPAGKKPGTRNRATRFKELLRDGEAEAAGRKIIDRAVAGDAVAARFLFDRLDPKPRGRPIVLARAAGTLAERFAALFAAVAEGHITPDEALALGRLLELERKAAGAAAGAPDIAVSPEPAQPAAAAECLHSACIAATSRPDEAAGAAVRQRAFARDAEPAPTRIHPPGVQAAPARATKRRRGFWQGSARVRRRAGMNVPPASLPRADPRNGRAS